MKNFVSGLRPADRLNYLFLLVLIAITLFFHGSIGRPWPLIVLYALLLCVQTALVFLKDRGALLRWVYDLIFPTVSILAIFDSLGSIVHSINPADIDQILIRMDRALFSADPTVMLEKISFPLLTDVLQLAYTSYYLLPLTLGVVLKVRGKSPAFDRSIFYIMLCFYLSYVGYMLMPAVGPRFTLNNLQTTDLKGFVLAGPIQELLNRLEGIKRDAFPSGHTGVALTVLYLAHRFERKLFLTFLPVVAALIFSTVYLRYHYVVDVLAGILLALLTILIGEIWYGRRAQGISTDY